VCTLAIFHRTLDDLPLVVAANRDEFYGRPATAPVVLGHDPLAVGGRDLVAGGSWLALNQLGLVVGVLNRRTDAAPDPSRESRGTLCVELARSSSARQAAELLRAVAPARHNPFNILVADRTSAFVAQNRERGTHVQELEHAHSRRQRLLVLRGRLLVRTARRSLVLRPRDPALTLRAHQRHATTALADTWVIAEYP